MRLFCQLALFSLLLPACRANSPRDPVSESPRAPELAEIFLEPSIAGLGPRAVSVSPDGEWLLLRWSGKAAERSDQGLRLLQLARAEDTGRRGTPLEELVLPGETTEAKLSRVRWLPEGARLVASRGKEVVLYDAPTGRTALLVVEAPKVLGEPDEEEVTDPHRRFDGSIRRLDLLLDGAVLDVLDAHEAYRIELSDAWPEAPIVLDDTEHVSADLDAPAIDLAFNLDSSIVFGASQAPRMVEVAEGETAPPSAHVLHRADGRLVSLVDFDADALDGERMSPDGRFVFAIERDKSESPAETVVPDYLTERVTTRSGRRLLAEDGPEPIRAWIWNTSSGARRSLLPDAEPQAFWTSSTSWAPQESAARPARLLFTTISADHRERVVHQWTEGFVEERFRDRDEGWIGGPVAAARWTPDGNAIVIGSEQYAGSSTPGRAQLFSVRADDGRTTQLTEVEGEVSDWKFADDGGIVLAAIRDDAASKWIGWIPAEAVALGEKDAVRWFPQPEGFNASLTAGPTAEQLVFTHERLFQPAELYLATPDASTQLTDTIPTAFGRVEWVHPERIWVEAADGTQVRAHVFVPPDWSPGDAARPTVVFIHGAGYLQNVTEAMTEYPLNLMFHSRLAQLGVPVIDVDYRGSAGYGSKFRTDVQYHLGGLDLTDIHDVVDDQIERGLVDGDRVGVYGGSYGGFLTMMALFTYPERWSVGAALRSVTDWRTYHPRYTQPRLGRPSTHSEAYEKSSPIDHVENLEDPLLVLHGMLDSNVFAQDSIRLIEELIDLGKDFDAMLYPSQGHGFQDGPHWLDEYRRIERYLLGHLGVHPVEPNL